MIENASEGAIMSVSVLLADPHQVFREGLRELLHANNNLKVIADVSNGDDAIRAISNHQVDIAIVDLFPSGMSTEDMIAHISRKKWKTSVIVLSADLNQGRVYGAIRSGAAGYVSKNASHIELLKAIDAVQAGDRYLSHELTEGLVARFCPPMRAYTTPSNKLTYIECAILRLIAEGVSSKEIATHLNLQTNAVENHRRSLMNKIDVHNIATLVRFAVREKITVA